MLRSVHSHMDAAAAGLSSDYNDGPGASTTAAQDSMGNTWRLDGVRRASKEGGDQLNTLFVSPSQQGLGAAAPAAADVEFPLPEGMAAATSIGYKMAAADRTVI